MAKIQEILTTRIGDFITQYHYQPNIIFLNRVDEILLVDECKQMSMIHPCGGDESWPDVMKIETFQGLAIKRSEESCVALALNLEMAKVRYETEEGGII